MPAINYREMRHMYDLDGPTKTCQNIREALAEGHLKANDFSIRDIAEALVPDGREWVRSMDPRFDTPVLEAGDGVDVTAFANVTGQIFYNKLLDNYQVETQITDSLVNNIPTTLDGEKIAGVDAITDDIAVVPPGMPIPNLGFGEEYIETPTAKKRAFIVPVTKEAIFFDRTGKILSQAASLGEVLGLNKAKRIWDALVGISTTFVTGGKFKYNGTEYSVYNTSAVDYTSYFYLNAHTNVLADYSDIDIAENLFANMTDPVSQEPIAIDGMRQLIVCPALMATARKIINATEVRETTNTNTVTLSASPLAPNLAQPISSAMMRARLIAGSVAAADANKYWLYGDTKKAFAYMENWPVTVTQSPSNSEAEFTQDIVVRYKASERGAVAVLDPRYMTRSTGAG